jgi:threonine/homoserine/homoserine lactone efflux protein
MPAGIAGFLFGVAIALAIGPIALLILRASLERGFGAGLACAAGAATADMLYALIAALAGTALVPRLETQRNTLAFASALVLVAVGAWLTVNALVNARRAPKERTVLTYGYRGTLALTLVNPLTLVAFASFMGLLPLGGRPVEAIGVAVAVGTGSFLVAATLAFGGATLRRWLADPRWILVLNIVSGVAIAAFGARGLVTAS